MRVRIRMSSSTSNVPVGEAPGDALAPDLLDLPPFPPFPDLPEGSELAGMVSGISGMAFSRVGPVDWPGIGTPAAAALPESEGAAALGGGEPAAGDGLADPTPGSTDCASASRESDAAAARRMRRLFIGTKAVRYCEGSI